MKIIMKSTVLPLLVVLFCSFNEGCGDDIDINNSTITDIPITEVNPPTSTPTPTSTTNATTITTIKTTTTPAPPTTTNGTTETTTKFSTPTTTTVKTTTPTAAPTAAPTKATTASPPSPSDRKFDGPSFVGGIVLALGLVAIGFVAFKFYKARTELNYHTL
ncbi:unnamed protein product [Brassicogethes aeneus]|uniref:Sialomucin core protein 24 n=1 Tax=Brassicogethes aeneus TaxID=1431903 RepID=A0A9P0B1J2_BRAAE|nr:unnamed protein product [Brassicogethes aeneus]